jgi:hypothetical protein
MQCLASELKSIAQKSVDQSEVKTIVNSLIDKAKEAAQLGRTYMVIKLLGDAYKTRFEYSEYNKDKALQVAVKEHLINLGFDFEYRHGVNGLYAVMIWG